jgi:hypothetical protein
MQIAMSNVLALMWWRGYRFYDDFGSRDLTWLLIGALLAFVGMWVYSRRSRRWFYIAARLADLFRANEMLKKRPQDERPVLSWKIDFPI